MFLPRLRSCLMAALLLAGPALAQPAQATEPAPAVGSPLNLVPSTSKNRPAKRRTSRAGRAKAIARGPGRSPLIEPEPAGAHEALIAALPGDKSATPAAPHEPGPSPGDARPLVPTVPFPAPGAEGGSHPANEAAHPPATTPGQAAEHAPSKAETPAEPADAPRLVAVAPPAAALKGPAEEASPRPAPLPAAPVVPVATTTPGESAPATPPARPAPQNDTQQYCSNIAAAAADARFAWQRKQITDLEAQLKQRVAELDAKQAEVAAVLARRDAVMKKATDTVLALYAGMKPDAAAEQIAALDDDMAAALLAQLPQRKASLILNQIPADKAAKLVAAIATVTPPEKKS